MFPGPQTEQAPPPKSAEELQADNADLRAKLEAENESLRERLAASQAESAEAQGLTDEDVRRIEQPLEFADDVRTGSNEHAPANDDAQ